MCKVKTSIWVICVLSIFTMLFLYPIPAHASHGSPEVVLPITKGVYRFPYQNGAEVRITRDHITHGPHNRLDMVATGNSSSDLIVAAGDGTIAYIVDSNDMACPRVTSSNPNPCSGYDGPSGNCCNRGNTTCYNNTAGRNICQNNFVIIRHPNGEWSRYSHLRVNSVTNQGWSVGDPVQAGQVLGREGDVGQATGAHLHLETAIPDMVDNSISPDQPEYNPLGINTSTCQTCGFPNAIGQGGLMNNGNRTNRIPIFCQIGFVSSQDVITARACDNQCTNANVQMNGTLADGLVDYEQSSNQISNSGVYRINAGAGSALRAGNRIILSPGFRAESGSFFSASTGPCDSPGT